MYYKSHVSYEVYRGPTCELHRKGRMKYGSKPREQSSGLGHNCGVPVNRTQERIREECVRLHAKHDEDLGEWDKKGKESGRPQKSSKSWKKGGRQKNREEEGKLRGSKGS